MLHDAVLDSGPFVTVEAKEPAASIPGGRVTIVSDSGILRSALESPVGEYFSSVVFRDGLTAADLAEEAGDSVFIIDCVDLGAVLQPLDGLDSPPWKSALLLLRGCHAVGELERLFDWVDAILPHTATASDVAAIAGGLRSDCMVLPRQTVLTMSAKRQRDGVAAAASPALTEREADVLGLLAQGMSNKMIGRQMAISDSTVRVHVRSILKKLKLQNRTQAALHAIRQ